MAVLFSSFSNVKPLSFYAANSVRSCTQILPDNTTEAQTNSEHV